MHPKSPTNDNIKEKKVIYSGDYHGPWALSFRSSRLSNPIIYKFSDFDAKTISNVINLYNDTKRIMFFIIFMLNLIRFNVLSTKWIDKNFTFGIEIQIIIINMESLPDNIEEYKKFKVVDLKQLLSSVGLPTNGWFYCI